MPQIAEIHQGLQPGQAGHQYRPPVLYGRGRWTVAAANLLVGCFLSGIRSAIHFGAGVSVAQRWLRGFRAGWRA